MTIVSADITRPADTTAYTAHDAICDKTVSPTVLTFANALRGPGGEGKVVAATIATDQIANVETFKLQLYKAPPSVYPADNAANDAPRYVDIASFIGTIQFGAAAKPLVGAPTASYAEKTGLNMEITNTDGTSNIYGVLESVLGFTPASGQKFHIELEIDRR